MGFLESVMGLLQRTGLAGLDLVRFPLVGEFMGRFIVHPPKFDDPVFGEASKNPNLLEIYVSTEKQWPLEVGKIVNDRYFPTDPPIVFNVCFSCSKPTLLHGGDYSNPESHWFNVFFGFYEIDVPKGDGETGWTRPFGFENDTTLTPRFEELMKIGKADWNYFSNHVYGVPLEECDRYREVPDPGIVPTVLKPSVHHAGHEYVEAQIDGMEVVSGYATKADGGKLGYPFCIFSPIWRNKFGRPRPSPSFQHSFPPTRMKMRFIARHEEGPDEDLGTEAYKTFIYGGAVNTSWADWGKDHLPAGYASVDDFLDEFLAKQMASVIATIEENQEGFRKMTRSDYDKQNRSVRHARWKKELF